MPPWDPRAGLVRGWSDLHRELEGPPGARLLRHQPATVPVLPILLGTQHLHHLPRNRLHPPVARDQGALADRPRTGASGVGVSGSPRLRADAGSALAVRGGRAKGGRFWRFFFPALTANVGGWATRSLNIPDFTRYAPSQRDQAPGQAFALPPAMGLFSFIGVAVTSGTIVIFGKAIGDPVELVAQFDAPVVHVVALLGLSLATLATNIAANVVSPANDFANLWPKCISFRTGGLITGLVGIVMQPWKLIADYFLVRHTSLDLHGLYREGGPYWYRRGFRVPALVALAAGVAPCLPGSLATVADVKVPAAWTGLYNYAWFVSFGVSLAVNAAWLRCAPSLRHAARAQYVKRRRGGAARFFKSGPRPDRARGRGCPRAGTLSRGRERRTAPARPCFPPMRRTVHVRNRVRH